MAIISKGDRKYLIIIHLGYDNGKRKTRSKRVSLPHLTPKQAEKEIIILEKEFGDEVKGRPDGDNKITLREFAKVYMSDYAEIKPLRPKTIASYNAELDKRILPEFGFMRLVDIRPMHLVKFYAKLKKQTYTKGKTEVPISDRTIEYQHQILSSILGKAVEWQILKENPCDSVSPPRPKKSKAKRKEKQWEEWEAIAFLPYIETAPLKYKCMVYLALIGGLRTEEILGLDVNDILPEGVSVRRTSKLVDGIGMVVEELTKNDSSERFVTLPAPVVADLKRQRTQQRAAQMKLGNLWESDRIMLFTQDTGKPMHGKTFYNWLKKTITKYNETHKPAIKSIAPHGLRHTSASLATYLGSDARTGAGRLGHAQVSTYLDMYGTSFNKADKEVSDKLGELLLPKVTTK